MFSDNLIDKPPKWMGFLLHSALSTILAMVVAIIASVVLEKAFGVRTVLVGELTSGPTFLLPMLSGLSLGYFFGVNYRDRAIGWVWFLPASILILLIAVTLASQYPRTKVWGNFFGPPSGCTSICLEQILFSGPFFTSVTYALGARLRFQSSLKTRQ